MKNILVCVDFADLLSVSLPRNKKHFSEIWVVTAPRDLETVEVCHRHGACVFLTDLFWRDGAVFNKWRALEAGLDAMGRSGWICIGDADVIWPDWVTNGAKGRPDEGDLWRYLRPGYLFSPLRHMWEWTEKDRGPDGQLVIPPEDQWHRYQIHRNVNEWAGYCQMFHESDPVLGPAPWHDITFSTAGAADSFFQAKWPKERKVRTPWNVLHVGPAGQNWFGRATNRLDTGEVPVDAKAKQIATTELWGRRARLRQQGKDQFAPERIQPT